MTKRLFLSGLRGAVEPGQVFQVPLIFEGLLAEIAACHVKENDLIHVSGKLSADSPQIIIDDHESTVKVLAQSLNFIETKPQDKEVQPFTKELDGVQLSDNAKDSNPTLACWNKFLANPGDWLDNRKHKRNPKAPDFKHKETGKGLWLDSSPDWVRAHYSPGVRE